MGLFSGSTKTYVASSVYNMAGDTEDNPSVLQSITTGLVLSGSKDSLTDRLVPSLLSGTGMMQRRFFQWARTNYELGLPTAIIDGSETVDTGPLQGTLRTLLGVGEDETLRILSAILDRADIDYWARAWVLENYPDAEETDWSADWDGTNNKIVVEIPLLNPAEPVHLMDAPADFLWGIAAGWTNRKLFFCTYEILSARDEDGIVTAGSPALFTYRMGTGNLALDALMSSPSTMAEFFPAIPLRLDNVSIADPSMTETYEAANKAYKKLTGKKIDDLLDQIEDNEDLDDIDYCFIVQGIPLNTKDNTGRKYLYNFFKSLIPEQKNTKTEFQNYKNWRLERLKENVAMNRWIQNNGDLANAKLMPLYNTIPVIPKAVSEPTITEVKICSEELPSFDMRLKWVYISEEEFAGNGKTYDADETRGRMKIGDYWFHSAPDIEISNTPVRGVIPDKASTTAFRPSIYPRIYMFHQHSKYRYSRLEIVGLEHQNYVYNGHAVTITAKQALTDDDITGFLVPLHYPSLTAFGLLNGTQLSSVSTNLVFNSYQVVKRKWYQTGIFRVILMIAGAVLSVILPPAGIGLAGSGILGSNLAIGAALGITSATMAAVVGAVANAIAAAVISQLIQKASTAIFGEKFGALIGTIVSFVAMTYANQYGQTGNFDVKWGELLKIDNLGKLTNVVSGAYTTWINADTADIMSQFGPLKDQYEERSKEIRDKSREILGMTSGEIDPMMLTDAAGVFTESPESFLSRTTLTGSDLAELSQVLIYEFTEMSLELPTAFS